MQWPNITLFLEKAGHITIGQVAHVEGAAIAADERTVFVTLVRRPDEPLEGLLQRLDRAIGQALHEGIHTNEVEGGEFVLAVSVGRRNGPS
jgi:hypothetical protein